MRLLLLIAISLFIFNSAYADYNYAEALQKAIFFFEGQQSGWLSPNNRVEWRAPAHTDDGQDAGIDLSGGWYDAGDHWKTNTTMASTITKLSWSALIFPEALKKTGQMDELLDNLKYGTVYFLKCIVDGHPDDPENFENFDLYFDVGNSLGPDPSVHSVWCAPEVTNGYTVREALRLNADAPGPDIGATMAASMAAASLVFHAQGETEYAATLYNKAIKLFHFSRLYPFDDNTLRDDGVYALTPADEFRKVGYRNSDPREKILLACGFLQRAANAFEPDSSEDYYLEFARDLYDDILAEYEIWEYFPWWKTHRRISPIMSLLKVAKTEKYRQAWESIVFDHVKAWEELEPTPGGYRIRDVFGGAFTLLKGTNETFLAMLYSNWTTNLKRKERFFNFAKSQMDYLLGDNPYKKSYMVGFGDNGWFNSLHHRGAQGPWAGFSHIQSDNPNYLQQCRHILYGAVPGGPDLNDVYEAKPGDWKHSEVTIESGASVVGVLAGLITQNPDAYTPIPDDQFPPKEERHLTTDLYETDREFFVVTRIRKQDDQSLQVLAQLNNRSSWPARVTDSLSFRCYFTLDNGATTDDLTVTLRSPRDGHMSPVTLVKEGTCYVEFSDPTKELWPNVDGKGSHYSHTFMFTIEASQSAFWDVSNDWSFSNLTNDRMMNLNIPVYENGVLLAGKTPFSTGITEPEHPKTPSVAVLSQNYPNPFNPVTLISFSLRKPANVKIHIYNVSGRFIKKLTEKMYGTGVHHLTWDATDERGDTVPSGIYYYRLDTKKFVKTRKMVYLK